MEDLFDFDLMKKEIFGFGWLLAIRHLATDSRGQNVSGRYKILYLDTFLGICIVSRYFFSEKYCICILSEIFEKYLADTS